MTLLKWVRALTLLVAASLVGGCSSPPKPKIREDFRLIRNHYNTQEYGKCLEEIQSALKTGIIKGQRALLLMTLGMCQEEMGHQDGAKATYTLVKMEFDLTSVGELARRRLAGRDGDQREHLEMPINDPAWKRATKQWNEKGVRCQFFPAGETPERYSVKLVVYSRDCPESIKTLDDAADFLEADFRLGGGEGKRRLIERDASGDYWETEQVSPREKGKTASLARLILANGRLHGAEITLRKPPLTAADRERYLVWLRTGKLVGSK